MLRIVRPISQSLSLSISRTFRSSKMSAKISLRLAKEKDFKDVLEISEGIYDGRDYLPFSFHRCLKSPNKYVFVAELQGKVIGLLNAVLMDGGQTLFAQSLRIHREYRGRNYTYQIRIAVIDRMRESHPQVSKMRYMVNEINSRMKYISQKLGHKAVMVRNNCRLESFAPNRDVFRGINNESGKQLHALGGKDADEFILNQRKFDALIPNKILIVLSEPFELMPANAGFIFEDDDKMFTDVSIEELRQDVIPRSFSHGRIISRVDMQSWRCNIYANDRHAFKAQLVRQLMAAIEQLEKVGRKSDVEVLYASDLDFDVKEVFEEVLGLEQATTMARHDLVLYEEHISK